MPGLPHLAHAALNGMAPPLLSAIVITFSKPLILVATHDSEREQRAHTVVCELAGQNSAPQVVSGELAEVHPVTIAVSGC